jgi:hypothetical protein
MSYQRKVGDYFFPELLVSKRGKQARKRRMLVLSL